MAIPNWLYKRFRREDGATFRRVGPYTRTTVGDYAITDLCGGWLFRAVRMGEIGSVELLCRTIYRWDHRPEEYR